MSSESLVVVAADLRKRAGLRGPPYSTTEIIDVCFEDVTVTGRALPKNVDEIVTNGLIIYKRGLSVPEQRFAIAHGIAHLLFDMQAEADACAIGFVGNPKAERRADLFGAELLVPLADLRNHVNSWPSCSGCRSSDREAYLDQVDRIAAKFNVPQWVISERIRKLECLTKVYGEIVLTE